MEIKIIQTVAYQVVTPIGNRRCFTKEGAYRALAKRMIKNHRRWQCECESGSWDDGYSGYICGPCGGDELSYVRKINLQSRLVRWLKYNYPQDAFTASNSNSTLTPAAGETSAENPGAGE